jgi:type IV secretory pathway TrbL component
MEAVDIIMVAFTGPLGYLLNNFGLISTLVFEAERGSAISLISLSTCLMSRLMAD